MRLHYDIEKIQQLLCAVSSLTGISMAFLDNQGRFLCKATLGNDYCSEIQKLPENRNKCFSSDKEVIGKSQATGEYACHICYAGLYDASMPLKKNGICVGSVIMGRVRTTFTEQNPMLDNGDVCANLYNKVPVFTDEQLTSLRVLLPNILFESSIRIEYDSLVEKIVEFISENYQSAITIGDICKRFHISKNVLYQNFRNELDCTVNDYIVNFKIERAKEMLAGTALPVYLIAEKCGFVTNTYFNRVFKKKSGITPSNYRSINNIK